jgi:hypothetical protein
MLTFVCFENISMLYSSVAEPEPQQGADPAPTAPVTNPK